MRRRVLIVLGMHRSGTSATAGVLSMLGLNFGASLLPAAHDNPKGFYENAEILSINERALRTLHSSWLDIQPLPDRWWLNEEIERYKEEIIETLRREFGDSAFCAIKDPRLCRLLPMWKAPLADLGFTLCFAHVIRNPVEVAASLHRRNGLTIYQSVMMWLRHIFEAEAETRGFPRVFVDYAQVLEDWVGTYGRIASELNIEWPRNIAETSESVNEFLTAKLRHHNGQAPELTGPQDIPPLAFDVYRELINATKDGQSRLIEGLSSCRERFYDSHGALFPLFAMLAQERQKDLELQEKDRQLQWKDAALAEKDAALAEKDAALAQKEALIADIYRSRSWRITKPLRWAHRLIAR